MDCHKLSRGRSLCHCSGRLNLVLWQTVAAAVVVALAAAASEAAAVGDVVAA